MFKSQTNSEFFILYNVVKLFKDLNIVLGSAVIDGSLST